MICLAFFPHLFSFPFTLQTKTDCELQNGDGKPHWPEDWPMAHVCDIKEDSLFFEAGLGASRCIRTMEYGLSSLCVSVLGNTISGKKLPVSVNSVTVTH